MRRSSMLLAAMALLATAAAPADRKPSDAARRTHEGLIVLDSHFDTPANLGRPGWSILDRHDAIADGDQVDLPRMVEGGVDGGFFAVFIAQGPRTMAGYQAARDAALVRLVQIREMVAAHRDHFALALTADDARQAVAAGKRFVFISMENGAPVAGDLSLLHTFRALGATVMSPVHTRNNDLADSATDTPEWQGLSPEGRRYVAEANRLGILLDGSHASDDATLQMVALSRAPIILTHSGMRAVYDHARNAPDDVAKAVAAKGGVIQINAFSGYMVEQPRIPERSAALAELARKYRRAGGLSAEERRAMLTERRAIDARWPVPRATIEDFMRHLRHAIDLVGIDHVGLSGDFDGGGGVDGLNDVADFPKVTAALLAAGYSSDDIGKFWGGNALRVLAAAQAAADPDAVPGVPITR